jgi:NADH:ubiquinone oxidoreductase subunit F (NADH-binding)
MGLFDLVSNAINDPNLQANVGQIGGIVNGLQQVQQAKNLDGDSTNTLLSLVGTQVRSSLKQQQENGTNVSELLEQFSGTASNAAAVSALFSGTQQQQLIEMAAAKTGIDANTIQSMLPTLVPLVLNFLQTGKSTSGEAGQNPVLSGFLDADGDGDVDIADAMMLASKFKG